MESDTAANAVAELTGHGALFRTSTLPFKTAHVSHTYMVTFERHACSSLQDNPYHVTKESRQFRHLRKSRFFNRRNIAHFNAELIYVLIDSLT